MLGALPQGRVQWGRVALVWLALAALLALVGLKNLLGWRFPDPDDILRLVQVRDLLAGQAWFDLHQYRISPGASPVMHWSRIVDLPIALAIMAFKPVFGQPVAEMIAVFLIPLITLGAVLAVVAKIAVRLFDREVAVLACLAVGLLPELVFPLQPMRIDHHGWQIFTVIFAVWAVMGDRAWKGGGLAGGAMAFGLLISLEVLPMAAALGAVLALRWVRDDGLRWWLVAYLAGLSAGLILLFAATRGFGDLVQYCDAIAPVHLGFFAIIAGLVGLIAIRPGLPGIAVAGLLGAAGMAGIAFYAWQAPQCLGGPFANLDPLTQQFWFANVLEGRPAWLQSFDRSVPIVAQGLVALAAVAVLWRQSQGAQRLMRMEYALMLGAAFLTGLFIWRSMAFAGIISAAPLGWLMQRMLARLRAAERALPKIGVALCAAVILLPAFPFVVAKMVMPASVTGNQIGPVRESSCELRENAPKLNRFPATIIFAPIDIGPSLLERSHHSVIATGHHRARAGMRDVIRAYMSPEAQAHELVRAYKADFVLVCTDLMEPRLYAAEAPDGLAAQLLNGDAPAWLEEVDIGAPSTFKLWRVTGKAG